MNIQTVAKLVLAALIGIPLLTVFMVKYFILVSDLAQYVGAERHLSQLLALYAVILLFVIVGIVCAQLEQWPWERKPTQ